MRLTFVPISITCFTTVSCSLEWVEWANATSCLGSCAAGHQVQTRQCQTENGAADTNCPGSSSRVLNCKPHICSKNNLKNITKFRPVIFLRLIYFQGWNNWLAWGPCRGNVHDCKRTRTRQCWDCDKNILDNSKCSGPSTDTELCTSCCLNSNMFLSIDALGRSLIFSPSRLVLLVWLWILHCPQMWHWNP